MLRGVDENGNLQNVNVSEDGAVSVKLEGASINEQGEMSVKVEDKEVTLLSEVLVVGTTATEKAINKKVTSIMAANYSETSDITITIGDKNYQLGANLALEFPINAEITNISIVATEASTKMQLVVKGVE